MRAPFRLVGSNFTREANRRTAVLWLNSAKIWSLQRFDQFSKRARRAKTPLASYITINSKATIFAAARAANTPMQIQQSVAASFP
jgi:hypothetical protein